MTYLEPKIHSSDSSVTVTQNANDVNLQIPAPSVGVFQFFEFTLTNSQIKNLHGTPIQILPAPGAGLVYQFREITTRLNYGGNNAFTASAGQGIGINYNGASKTAWLNTTAFNTITHDEYYQGGTLGGFGSNVAITEVENQAIILYNSSSTEIGGNAANDNTITVSFYYYLNSL